MLSNRSIIQNKSANKNPITSRPDSGSDGSWRNHMHKQTAHKELHDPFAHYTRGILYFDEETFTFIAHREPYCKLNKMTWESERAFMADYQRLIARKYSD